MEASVTRFATFLAGAGPECPGLEPGLQHARFSAFEAVSMATETELATCANPEGRKGLHPDRAS